MRCEIPHRCVRRKYRIRRHSPFRLRNCWEGRSVRASSLLRQLAKGGCAARRLSWVTPGFSQSRRCKTTASEFEPTLPVAMPAQTIWYAITAMPPTPSSCIRIISSGLFSGSVIAQAGAIWASGRKKPVPFPARLKRHGKSLPRMTAAALTLSENARLP